MAIWNDRIKQLRKKKDITLKVVAEYIGSTEATAQRYESGNGIKNIPYDVIVKYSELFNCSPAYLMGWESEEKIADNLYSVTISPKIQALIDVISDMSTEQIDKLIEYAEFLKLKKEGN